jgi:hypothetical protein
MRWLMAICLMLLAGAPPSLAGPAAGLEAYQWKNRVLVVSVRRFDQIALARQKQILRSDLDGMAERDIVAFARTNDAVLPIVGAAPARMPALAGPPGGFEAVLFGKDGSVRMRWQRPVSLNDLFAVIDAMPMRQREMRAPVSAD